LLYLSDNIFPLFSINLITIICLSPLSLAQRRRGEVYNGVVKMAVLVAFSTLKEVEGGIKAP